MAAYYLISQLPSLDGIQENMPLPITEERFAELCSRFLKAKEQEKLQKLTLLPVKIPEVSGSSFIDTWNERERTLRFALGKVRAEKWNFPFDTEGRNIPAKYIRAAGTAIEMENPMEAEKFLNRFRLELLEEQRPMDGFADDYIFYYGLRLKLLLRIRQFDTEAGEAAYRKIYNSILHKDRLEALS